MSNDPAIFGEDMFGDAVKPSARGVLADKYTFPPFTVLNARDGEWVKRKKAWIDLGIKGEIGRLGVECALPESAKDDYERLIINSATGAGVKSGVSVFDPVLCNLMYQWFASGGQVVDPFAGGSVRGIVAAIMGLRYWGCDLSEKQICANIEQGKVITPDNQPRWIAGDAIDKLEEAPEADFIFSCPPYGSLEKYSDDPRDLSAMELHTFNATYKRIILKACKKLKNNRFACFVVANYRDKKGNLNDLCGETIKGFDAAGLRYYNEAVLVTQAGSASMRADRQFSAAKKLVKTHQNVLIFVKGDPSKTP
jgi:16S rRNA G966 N2-methylase RsmD